MKHLFLIFSFLFIAQFGFGQEYATIQGTLRDSITNEGLIAAKIIIYKTGTDIKITGASTDIEGNYSIDSLPFGSYDIEFLYLGYFSFKQVGVTIEKSVFRLDVSIREYLGLIKDVIEIITITIPLIQQDKFEQGRIYEAEEIERMPIKW